MYIATLIWRPKHSDTTAKSSTDTLYIYIPQTTSRYNDVVFCADKTDLRNFVAAVREALQHFPLSTFDVELPSDRELDEIATPVPTPQPARVWRPFLHDSEIFTPGTDSRGDTGGSVTRSQRRLRQRPTTPVQCQSVPLTSTAEKAKSDILPKVVWRRSGQKKRRQCSPSPYSSEKRSKIDEEEEGGRSGADCDVRRRLDLEESMDDAVVDILTICGSSGGDTRECEVRRGEGRENGESGERGVCGGAEQNGTSGRECGDGRVSKNSEVTLTLGREREETSAGETTEEGRKEEPVSRMEFEQNKEGTDEPRQKKARVKEPKSAKVVKKLEKKREKEEKEEKKREKERGEEEEREGGKTMTTEEEESDPSSEDDDLPNYQTTSTTKVTSKTHQTNVESG